MATTAKPLQATPPVKSATESDEQQQVIATIVLAFDTDPVVRWMYQQPSQYLTSWPDFVRAFGGRAFEHGTAHYVEGYAGAALWLPPGAQPDEDALASVIQRTIAESELEDLFRVLEQMGTYHPSEPHWHLALIGVEPVRQRQGLGSALLDHALAVCDRDGLPAYLESSNPANIPLYERHGFDIIGTIQSGSSPTMWPMLRKPR